MPLGFCYYFNYLLTISSPIELLLLEQTRLNRGHRLPGRYNGDQPLSLLEAFADVVRTRMFVTSVDHYDAVARAHSEAFDDVRPATSMYEIAALVDPAMLVEVEASAVVA